MDFKEKSYSRKILRSEIKKKNKLLGLLEMARENILLLRWDSNSGKLIRSSFKRRYEREI